MITHKVQASIPEQHGVRLRVRMPYCRCWSCSCGGCESHHGRSKAAAAAASASSTTAPPRPATARLEAWLVGKQQLVHRLVQRRDAARQSRQVQPSQCVVVLLGE